MRTMKDSGIEWVKDIPAEWNVAYLSSILSERKNKNSDMQENNLLSLSYGNVKRKDINTNDGLLPESFEGYNIIEKDDIVLRLTDLQNDHRSLRTGLCKERGIITSAYCTLKRNTDNFDSRFLQYYLYSFDVCKGFYGMGAGVRQGLNFDGIRKVEIAFPSLLEQQRIADTISTKCGQVESLIANQEAQIEKLKAYKQSLITEAVTKGLNPNDQMKDSGVEWIGQIPKHWEIKPLLREIDSIVDYRGKTPEKVDDGVLLVTAKNIKDGKINYSISREYVKAEEYDEIMRRGKLHIGDVLFTTEAPLGAVANVDRTDFALAQRIIKFSTKKTLNPYFLKYWILSNVFQQHLQSFATGSTAAGIKASKLCLLQLVYPPIETQMEIVNKLDKDSLYVDRLISIKQQKIEKLNQYKKSLIFEYVTGKKEVSC